MKVPGDSHLSNAEIVAFVDLAAGEIPGWVPSEHFDEHSLVVAFRAAQHDDNDMFDMITGSPQLAQMIMAGSELLALYRGDPSFGDMIETVVGPGNDRALSAFMQMRADILVKQVADWDSPLGQLAMFQLDSFLLGWLYAHRTLKDHG